MGPGRPPPAARVVDSAAQCTSAGELQHVEVSTLHAPVIELPLLLADGEPGPHSGITGCDLTGLGAADAAVATLAVRALPR